MVVNKLSLLWLLVGIALVTGCNATGLVNLQSGNILADQKWSGQQASFTVPFEWHDGHPIINLSINGQKNLRFALDSGAAATVLFETERTKTINLPIAMQLDLQGAQVNVANDVNIIVGSISLSNMTIIHVPIDQSPLFGDIDEAYFDGAIGFDIMSRFTTRFNYANKSVTFFNEDQPLIKNDDWVKLPMEIIGRIPHVLAELQNDTKVKSTYTFTIDTGAPDYLYINSTLAEDVTFPTSFYESQTSNFEGEFKLRTSRLDSFTIANTSFMNIATHDLPHLEDENGVGLIGSGLLRNFDVIFDYNNDFVAFKKNQQFSSVTYIDRSGLQLEPHIKGAVVKYVAKNTHAAKIGISSGDIVTTINDEKLNNQNFDQLRGLLSSNITKMNICWQSKKKQQCKIMHLADRI